MRRNSPHKIQDGQFRIVVSDERGRFDFTVNSGIARFAPAAAIVHQPQNGAQKGVGGVFVTSWLQAGTAFFGKHDSDSF